MIKKYLLNFYNRVRDVEVDTEYKKLLRRRDGIKNILQKIDSRTPNCINRVECGQTGGMPLEKVNAIKKIIEKYNQLNSKLSESDNVSDEAKNKIDEIVKLINEIDYDNILVTTEDGEILNPDLKIANEESVQNTMDVLATVLKTSKDLFEVNKLRGQTYLPVAEVIKTNSIIDEEYKTLKNVFNDISEKLNELKDKNVKEDTTIESKVSSLVEQLKLNNSKREKKSDIIINEYTRLKQAVQNRLMQIELKIDEDIDFNSPEYRIKQIDNETFKSDAKGSYTRRIENSYFSKENVDIMKDLTAVLLKDDQNEQKIMHTIYNPQFQEMMGGANTEDEIIRLVTQGQEISRRVSNAQKEYQAVVDRYNLAHNHYLQHTAFLLLVATSQLVQTESYVVYSYINEGIIVLYEDILSSMIKEMREKNTNVAVYLKKYHYITIHKLHNFFNQILNKKIITDPLNKISIDDSGTKVRYYFHLFNHFKRTMDNYKRLNMNEITIYARINDFDISTSRNERVFASDHYLNRTENYDHRRLVVQKDRCSSLRDNGRDEFKFTQVFDSEKFKDINVVSDNMALASLITEGKGIALMTYGYSGVGKTFTLFGKKKGDKTDQGILQTTLDNISGLNKVELRLFELYGRGSIYPHYWRSTQLTRDQTNSQNFKEYTDVKKNVKTYCPLTVAKDNKVYQYLRYFNIMEDKTDKGEKVLKVSGYEEIKKEDIPLYTNAAGDYQNTFKTVLGEHVKQTFRNIADLIDSVDDIRKKIGTIRKTPNNPESSRSMIVYDFRLYVGSVVVPLIIIDLPGREEIVQSYVDTFLNDNLKDPNNKNNIKVKQLRIALSALCLNPLLLPTLFMDAMYNRDGEYNIIGKTVVKRTGKDQLYNIILREFNELDSDTRRTGLKDVMNQVIGRSTDNKDITAKMYYSSTVNKDNRIEFENNYPVFIPERRRASYAYDFQYMTGLCGLIMNNLILAGKTDALDKIFKAVADILIQKHRDLLKEDAKFDYITAPSEGIFINENIAGLIQYLAKKLTRSDRSPIEKQDASLDLTEQIKKVRGYAQLSNNNLGIYKMTGATYVQETEQGNSLEGQSPRTIRAMWGKQTTAPSEDSQAHYSAPDKPEYVENTLDMMYETIKGMYKSDRIFNSENPVIENILCPYLPILEDYKVFYLFSNNDSDRKCEHQIKLLENTEGFIKTIVPQ